MTNKIIIIIVIPHSLTYGYGFTTAGHWFLPLFSLLENDEMFSKLLVCDAFLACGIPDLI